MICASCSRSLSPSFSTSSTTHEGIRFKNWPVFCPSWYKPVASRSVLSETTSGWVAYTIGSRYSASLALAETMAEPVFLDVEEYPVQDLFGAARGFPKSELVNRSA